MAYELLREFKKGTHDSKTFYKNLNELMEVIPESDINSRERLDFILVSYNESYSISFISYVGLYTEDIMLNLSIDLYVKLLNNFSITILKTVYSNLSDSKKAILLKSIALNKDKIDKHFLKLTSESFQNLSDNEFEIVIDLLSKNKGHAKTIYEIVETIKSSYKRKELLDFIAYLDLSNVDEKYYEDIFTLIHDNIFFDREDKLSDSEVYQACSLFYYSLNDYINECREEKTPDINRFNTNMKVLSGILDSKEILKMWRLTSYLIVISNLSERSEYIKIETIIDYNKLSFIYELSDNEYEFFLNKIIDEYDPYFIETLYEVDRLCQVSDIDTKMRIFEIIKDNNEFKRNVLSKGRLRSRLVEIYRGCELNEYVPGIKKTMKKQSKK